MRKFLQAPIIFVTAAAPVAASAQFLPTPAQTSDLIIEQPSDRASDILLGLIVMWLSANFDLQPTTQLPKVKYAPEASIRQRRYRKFLGTSNPIPQPGDGPMTTVAIYDRSEATIYLSQGWTGKDPAELSVLVHEMVHHLQSVAQAKFECPQARERLAYAAQQRWLKLFGHTLEEDFQIDPLTLLVTTRCMH